MPPKEAPIAGTLMFKVNNGDGTYKALGNTFTSITFDEHPCEGSHGAFHRNWLYGDDWHVDEKEVRPERVVRNGPALVVFWQDGTKTVVKCHDEEFDAEKGLAMALARKLWGRSQTMRYVREVEVQE